MVVFAIAAAAGVAVVCAALAALATLWRVRRSWQHLQHLPGPPPQHWATGHLQAFLGTDAPMQLASWANQYGGAYRIRFFTAFAVILTDPALVRAALQNSKSYVPKDRRLYRAIEVASCVPLPNILTSSDGDYWRLVRGAWMKCFTSPNLKRVLPVLQDICARVTQQIQQQAAAPSTAAACAASAPAGHAGGEAAGAGSSSSAAAEADGGGPAAAGKQQQQQQPGANNQEDSSSSIGAPAAALVNMCNVTDRITLDVIGHVSYGRDFGAVEHRRSRYLELVSGMLQLMHDEMDHPWRKLLQRVSLRDRAKALLRADWDAANTAEVMRAIADPPPEHTIAGQLLRVRDPVTGLALTPQQLKSEMCIATLAGFETTSNALSWTLGALACHPEAMRRLEQELDGAGLLVTPRNPQPAPFEWTTLGKLPYLQAVIREGLRLFSPAANGSWRMCATTDIQLTPELLIPKNTAVGVPWFAFGHSRATYGPDAEAFNPERWLCARAKAAVDPAGISNSNSAGPDAGGRNTADKGAAAAGVAAAAASKLPNDPWSFSIGPRDCAGQALARMELQVVVASLVGAFRLALAPEVGGWQGLLGRRMYHTTLQVAGGLPMLLTPRESSAAAADVPGRQQQQQQQQEARQGQAGGGGAGGKSACRVS